MDNGHSTPAEQLDTAEDWREWLEKRHATSKGVWLRLARKGSNAKSISFLDALDIALCYGWVDQQKQRDNDDWWLQRFTPRPAAAKWGRRACERAESLIKAGRMRVLAYNHPTRSPQLPDVPTMQEAGISGTVIDGSWYGMFAPPRTPDAAVARLVTETRAVTAEHTQGDDWIVTAGLKPGDRLITQGLGKIRANQPVKPVPEGASQAPRTGKAKPAASGKPG